MKRFYITTPIYYVNDKPHIGHAYTSIASDALARFKRLDGYNVKFLTGTDEHGLKIERAAQSAGQNPQDFVDQVSENFRDLSNVLNLSNDDFIRTTEPRHEKAVIELWNRLVQNDEIYLGKYSGWYAVSDEEFISEKDIKEVDGVKVAPSGSVVEWHEEESYFFRLSAYQEKLLSFYENYPSFIGPDSRRNEVISLVKNGLQDLSISRVSFDWGIKVPNDPKHIIYVWLDALTNYISAIAEDDFEFENYWANSFHIIGKDILKFHAIYWPAFLFAADVQPPKRVFAHGWWTNNGEKISKSKGNVIDPIEITKEYGIDAFRYFLLREVTFGQDGDFSEEALIRRYNTELANDLGNLLQRCSALILKYRDGFIPNSKVVPSGFLTNIRHEIDQQNIGKVLDILAHEINRTNKYFSSAEPWALLKSNDRRDQSEADYVLAQTIDIIKCCALVLQAFIPESAGKILDYLGVSERTFDGWYASVGTNEIGKPEPIFPKIA